MDTYNALIKSNDAMLDSVLKTLEKSSLELGLPQETVKEALKILRKKYKTDGIRLLSIPGTVVKGEKKKTTSGIKWNEIPGKEKYCFTKDISYNNHGYIKLSGEKQPIIYKIGSSGFPEVLDDTDILYLSKHGLSCRKTKL